MLFILGCSRDVDEGKVEDMAESKLVNKKKANEAL
jgi:hypothetical protein